MNDAKLACKQDKATPTSSQSQIYQQGEPRRFFYAVKNAEEVVTLSDEDGAILYKLRAPIEGHSYAIATPSSFVFVSDERAAELSEDPSRYDTKSKKLSLTPALDSLAEDLYIKNVAGKGLWLFKAHLTNGSIPLVEFPEPLVSGSQASFSTWLATISRRSDGTPQREQFLKRTTPVKGAPAWSLQDIPEGTYIERGLNEGNRKHRDYWRVIQNRPRFVVLRQVLSIPKANYPIESHQRDLDSLVSEHVLKQSREKF